MHAKSYMCVLVLGRFGDPIQSCVCVLGTSIASVFCIRNNGHGPAWHLQVLCASPAPFRTLLLEMRCLVVLALIGAVSAAFYQLQCSDSACTQNCQKISFPEKQCLQLQGGGSVKVQCESNYVQETFWLQSTNCTGSSQTSRDKTGVCEEGSDGTYFENVCTNSTVMMSKANFKKLRL